MILGTKIQARAFVGVSVDRKELFCHLHVLIHMCTTCRTISDSNPLFTYHLFSTLLFGDIASIIPLVREHPFWFVSLPKNNIGYIDLSLEHITTFTLGHMKEFVKDIKLIIYNRHQLNFCKYIIIIMKFENNYNISWMYVRIMCMFDSNYRNGENSIYRIFQVEWHSFGTHCTMFRVLTGIWVKTTLCDNVKVQVIFRYILSDLSSSTFQCSYLRLCT